MPVAKRPASLSLPLPLSPPVPPGSADPLPLGCYPATTCFSLPGLLILQLSVSAPPQVLALLFLFLTADSFCPLHFLSLLCLQEVRCNWHKRVHTTLVVAEWQIFPLVRPLSSPPSPSPERSNPDLKMNCCLVLSISLSLFFSSSLSLHPSSSLYETQS